MHKQRMAVLLIVGILLGLLVSACGVAIGQTQFVAAGPAGLNPLALEVALPSLLGAQARPAAQMHAVALTHSLQAADHAMAQPQVAAPFHSGACHGDDGFYGSYSSSDD